MSRLEYSRWLGSLLLGVLALTGCGRDQGTPGGSPSSAPGTDDGSSRAGAPGSAKAVEPIVRMETSLGDITLRLDSRKAPLTVDNFLQYVERGHYNGTVFHQVNQGYALVGGSYTEGLTRKPAGVAVRNEAHNGLKNRRGTIAMARLPEAIDSATCEFYLNLADNPQLDHKDATPEGYGYCVFGEVTEGLDVLDKIGSVAVREVPAEGASLPCVPVEPVLIKTVRRVPQ